MAMRVKISCAVFILCSILPLLASAFLNDGLLLTHDHASPEDDSGSFIEGAPHENDDSISSIKLEKAPKKSSKKAPKKQSKEEPANQKYDVYNDYGTYLESQLTTQEKKEQPKNISKPLDQDCGLKMNFYEKSCPRVEQIVKEIFTRVNRNDPKLAAGILRLHVHDCFVQGCDASLLLDNDPSGKPTEKKAGANGEFIKGTELIDEIKTAIEKECPGVVSCSDILTYATRDALVLSGVQSYDVPGGRRDGLSSLETQVARNLPFPDTQMNEMIDLFGAKGLSPEDLVILTGAHSIGEVHCANFAYRMKDAGKKALMNPTLLTNLGMECGNPKNTVPFDTVTRFKMDSVFYKQLLLNRTVIETDHFIANDPRTRPFVEKYAKDQATWLQKFAQIMVKMSKMNVLSGNAGEIRKQCRYVNGK